MSLEINPPGRVNIVLDADGVAQVRLIRTDKMNALDPDMFAALIDAGRVLHDLKGLRAVVLAGEGRSFCAGLDLTSMANTARHDRVPLTERTHGNAKVARDLAAEIFNRIEVETHLLLSLMSKGKLIREEGLERLAKMNRLANIGCRILQEQGAQIRPMQFEDLL